MQNRYWIFQRSNEVFYLEDRVTGKHTNLRTKNRVEADRLFAARNQAIEQPAMNISMAKAYPLQVRRGGRFHSLSLQGAMLIGKSQRSLDPAKSFKKILFSQISAEEPRRPGIRQEVSESWIHLPARETYGNLPYRDSISFSEVIFISNKIIMVAVWVNLHSIFEPFPCVYA